MGILAYGTYLYTVICGIGLCVKTSRSQSATGWRRSLCNLQVSAGSMETWRHQSSSQQQQSMPLMQSQQAHTTPQHPQQQQMIEKTILSRMHAANTTSNTCHHSALQITEQIYNLRQLITPWVTAYYLVAVIASGFWRLLSRSRSRHQVRRGHATKFIEIFARWRQSSRKRNSDIGYSLT